jgi:CO/xanthine dehydrogenase FAD-binding subunit
LRPAFFDFHAPRSLEHALALLDELGSDATPLAGGQTLIPLLNMRLARPAHVVDLNRVADLSFIDVQTDGLRIGAMTRQYQIEVSDKVRRRCPLLAYVMPFVGHTQTRSRGTLGGSLAFASSVGELGVALLALGADLKIAGSSGVRTLPIDAFFVDYLTSALRAGELLTDVRVNDLQPQGRWGFSELRLRSCDFAIALAAVTIALDASGRCIEARIALGGAAATPVRVRGAEAELTGRFVTPQVIQSAAAAVRESITDAADDVSASAEYRLAVLPLQVMRALTMAMESTPNG